MLYDLVKKWRGKTILVMTDQLPKVNNKRKQLLASQRKGVKDQTVEYVIQRADPASEKYVRPPVDMHLSGQPRREGPPRINRRS